MLIKMNESDKSELEGFTKDFSEEDLYEFDDLLDNLQFYGGDLNHSMRQINSFGRNSPIYVKRLAVSGFLGDLLIFTDVGREQMGSLVYKLINDLTDKPKTAERIFQDKEFSDKYQKTMQRAVNHLAKREYFKNQEGKMEVFPRN